MVMLPKERAMLQRLAEDAGAKGSALLREWISEKYAARFGKKRPGEVVPKYNSAEAREAKPKREIFPLSQGEVACEATRQLLRQPIENDNDPDFQSYDRWDGGRMRGVRRSPSLGRRLKHFGRFAEILAAPLARIEGSRWRDMPALTFVAPHALQCACYRCLKLQQTALLDDDGAAFSVPTYIETPEGYRTVEAEHVTTRGGRFVLDLDGRAFELVKCAETDAHTGNAHMYDAWAPCEEASP